MGKVRGQHSNVIKGPIGKGIKLNLQSNPDGSLNYTLAIKEQLAKIKTNATNVSKSDSSTIKRDEGFVSQYVRELRSGIGSIQSQKKEQQERFADRVPLRDFSKSGDFFSRTKESQSKAISKQPEKNEPTIDR